MGSGLCPPWPEALVFWKAWSLTSEEGPKPRVGSSLTFGEGPENLSILFSKFLKGRSLTFREGLKPGPGPARARLSKLELGPGPYF